MNEEDNKLVPPPQLMPKQHKAWDAYYQPRRSGRLQSFRAVVAWLP